MYHTVETLDKLIHAREFQIEMLRESSKSEADIKKKFENGRRSGRLILDVIDLKQQRDELIENANKPFWKKLLRK